MVATLPHHRGKHLASKLLAARARRGETTRQDHHLPAGLQARPGHLRPPRLPRARRGPPLREAAAVSLNPALEEAKYCPRCGQPATVDYPRSINCPHCGYGAYYNPKPVAAAIPVTTKQRDHPAAREASTPARTCGRSPAASSTSANRWKRRPAERRRRSSRSTIELTRPRRRLLATRGPRRPDRLRRDHHPKHHSTTAEATRGQPPSSPTTIPWQELAFWSTTNALKDFLARS